MKQTIFTLLLHYASWAQASSAPLWAAASARSSDALHRHRSPSYRRRRGGCCDATPASDVLSLGTAHPYRRGRHGICFVTGVSLNNISCNKNRYKPEPSPIPKQIAFALSSTRSKITEEMGTDSNKKGANKSVSKKKKKNGVIAGAGANTGRRMKKSEIDDLVRGIGLEPVVQSSPSKKKRKAPATINILNSQQIQNNDDHEQKGSDYLSILQQSPPSISLQIQLDYSRNGHAALRSFLPNSLIQQLRSELVPYAASHALSAWRQKVEVQLADSSDEYYRDNAQKIVGGLKSAEECMDMLESLGVDPTSGDLPFLQHFNTWRSPHANAPAVKQTCLSHYLAQTASILLNCSTVRLYQDSLFHKRVGDGWTPWHSDARMAPFDTSKMITFWIPLQKVPTPEEGGTGLLFVDCSHSDFALPYWNGAQGKEYNRLEHRYGSGDIEDDGGVSHHMPLELGDVTVHNGWTLHCADAAPDSENGIEDRYAFSVTYVDGRAELRENVLSTDIDNVQNNGVKGEDAGPKGDREDVWSFRSWAEEVEPRTEFRHPEVPIVWPPAQRDV